MPYNVQEVGQSASVFIMILDYNYLSELHINGTEIIKLSNNTLYLSGENVMLHNHNEFFNILNHTLSLSYSLAEQSVTDYRFSIELETLSKVVEQYLIIQQEYYTAGVIKELHLAQQFSRPMLTILQNAQLLTPTNADSVNECCNCVSRKRSTCSN